MYFAFSYLTLRLLLSFSIVTVLSLGGGGGRGGDEEGKLAFLFLTRDRIYYEQVWKIFFMQALSSEYNIYVHTRMDFTFDNSSFFYKTDLSSKVPTVYGNTIFAQRELLREALKDSRNSFFILVSEFCIPLYSFRAIYFALFYTNKTVIDACRPFASPRYDEKRDLLLSHGINSSIFRRSSQFFAMTRKHALIFANDDDYIRVFDMVKFPVHHYYGTYLALKGLSLETTCSTGFNFQKWDGRTPHPEVFLTFQIIPDLFQVGLITKVLSYSIFVVTITLFFIYSYLFHFLIQYMRTCDICKYLPNSECSGTPICHFTARKFDPSKSTVAMVLKNIQHILVDNYIPDYLYANNVAARLRINSSSFNCSAIEYFEKDLKRRQILFF